MVHGIYRGGALVAAATARRGWIVPRLARRRKDDPERVTAELACQYVHDVYAGLLQGPVRSRDAWRYAKLAYDHGSEAALEQLRASSFSETAKPGSKDRRPYRPAPWSARVLLLLGGWLTVMYTIQAIAEANGLHDDQGAPAALPMAAIGLGCLAGAWIRLKLGAVGQRLRRRRRERIDDGVG